MPETGSTSTSPSRKAAGSETLGDSRLRVHGPIRQGSLKITPDRSSAEFQLEGAEGQLNVICKGPLPDNLKEDIEVVVEGTLHDSTTLQGDRVLTRCASKYESKDIEKKESFNESTKEEKQQ